MKTQIRSFPIVLACVAVLAGGWWMTKRLTPSHRALSTDRPTGSQPAPESALAPADSKPETPLQLSAGKPSATPKATRGLSQKAVTPKDTPPNSVLSQTSPQQAEIAEKLSEELREKPRYDQPGEALEYYRLKRLPPGETEIPVEKYLTAKTQMDAMPQYSSAQNRLLPSRNELKANRNEATAEALGTWEPLGPGNIGGRTRALLIHPTTPTVMYAAGVAGGVWKTTNAGARWEPLTDLMANIAVSCLAFDPGNPNTIYAGTGEGFFNGNAVRGAGIFRTTDGGANWTQLTATGTPDFYYVNDLVISKANPQRLYAGTRTGVWRSLDGGATWEKVLNYADGCLDLVIRTDQMTDVVFAACGTFGGAEVFRNTDAGGAGTWTSVLKESGMGRTTLALAPSNQNIVYAVASSTLSGTFRYGLHAVFRSTNGGEAGSWNAQVRNNNTLKLNTVLFSNPLGAFRSECGLGPNGFSNQGWYNNVIAVDPLDENKVWVGGVDLFRSDDGGANWGLASYWWPEPSIPQYAHADQHVIAFHPQYNGTNNKQMYIGNDGGVFRTDDARAAVATGITAACNPSASGMHWTSLNNNYGVTQFYHGAVFPDGKSYFGGTQDNGTLLGTDASGANGWREIYGGDGGYVAIDPTNPNVLYASTPGGGFRKSTNGGETFGSARLGISDTTLFIAPLAIDPSDPQRLWTGGAKLWSSENGGASWRDVLLSNLPLVSAIVVSPHDSGNLLVGTSGGTLRTVSMRNEYGTTFDRSLRGGFVSSVAYDPTDRQIAYATYSTFGGNHVWKSTNGGYDWQAIDGAGPNRLPDIPAHSVVVDPTDHNRVFVGTDLGVFVTTDGGRNWAVENTGFANTPVEWLVINTANNVTSLYAFTHGRGVARVNIGGSVCAYSLSATRQTISAAGGSDSIGVTGANGCAWTASSNADWIVLTGVVSGSGNGRVGYSIAPNPFLAKRVGTLTIAGRSFTITQEPRIDVSPPVITITSPTTSGRFMTPIKTMKLSGTAADNLAIEAVSWMSNRGGSGLATGTNNWVIPSVPLQPGSTEITVTAKDASGNLSSASLLVISLAEYLINTIAGGGTNGPGDGGPAINAQLTNAALDVTFDQQGNLYLACDRQIRKIDTNGIITTIAGTGTNTTIDYLTGIAIDSAGNLILAEPNKHWVRRLSPNGTATVIAGTGALGFSGDGGLATAATMDAPFAVAFDSEGDLYITDVSRIRKVDRNGIIQTVGGGGSTLGDGGPATAARLIVARDIAFDKAGNLFIADLIDGRIRKVTKSTGIISTVAGGGTLDYEEGINATAAKIASPNSVVVDELGNLYFSENQIARVRRVSSSDGVVFTIAGGGTVFPGDGGPATDASLSSTYGIWGDKNGNIFIASNSRIYKVTPYTQDSISPTVQVVVPIPPNPVVNNNSLSLSGTASDNRTITHITWRNDRGGSGLATGTTSWAITNTSLRAGVNNLVITAWDAAGNSTTTTLAVTYIPPSTFTTLAGARNIDMTFSPGFNLESGSGLASQFYAPETVALDSVGNLYIADKGNHRIRKVTRSGLISTVAGNGQLGSSGDGGLAIDATLNQPNGIAVDNSGNLYISDTNNHRIRKVNAAGVITTIAGTGIGGFAGDGGLATQAQCNTPVGITLDHAGNLLIADAGNHRIRKVNLGSGLITTIAGNGYGSGGDGGQATAAQLNFPTSVALDQAGSLYISDTLNQQVRKVSATGIITRFAGSGTAGFSGDAGPAVAAQFSAPGGLTVDAAGNVYIADQGNHRVRKVAADGTITTVAGNGTTTSQPNDEGGAATNAALNAPAGVAVDAAGNLFIADTNNHRVVVVAAYQSAATVNAASYANTQPVAAESLVSVFGANLATRDQVVTQLPLPTELAGTSVKVRDSLGVERLASLFYVGKLQVNYQIPAGTAAGYATVTITNGNGEIFTSAVNITNVTPGLFTANQNGSGPAAASVLFVRNGVFRYESNFACDAQGQNCTARQIDLNAGDEVFLELYGTGLRNNSGLSNVLATVGGVTVPVLYANKQPDFIGLDQVNIALPKTLLGRGEVDVVLTVDGKAANPVKIHLK